MSCMLFLSIHLFIMETMENIIEQSRNIILWCEQKINELTQDIKEMNYYCKSPWAKPHRKKEMELAIAIFTQQIADFKTIKQDTLSFNKEIMLDSYINFRAIVF